MATELSFNKKMGLAKLILSSLFARKQKYLILNGRQRNKFFFSSMTSDRVQFYTPDIDDTLAMVTVSEKIATILYELFPLFKDVIAIIHLPTFTAAINKKLAQVKGENPQIVVNPITETIEVPLQTDDSEEGLFIGDESVVRNGNAIVGRLIIEDTFDGYEAIFKRFTSFVQEPIEKEITIPEAYSNDRVIMSKVDIKNQLHDCMIEFQLPIQDGTSVVSFKEYLTKRKAPWTYKALIQYSEKLSVAKVSYAYHDDYVDVVSTAPGTLWFPYRKHK